MGGLIVHTSEDAAAILHVRQSWLERQAAQRRVPFTMLGGSYRFTDEHLAEIVRRFEQTPKEDRVTVSAIPRQRTRRGAHEATPTTLRARPRPAPRRAS
jgi:hypothetical protein